MARDGKQDATIHPRNLNIAWSHLIVRQLIASGCTTFIASPGMRNGPLISAISHTAQLKINVDERSAAYQALGFCKGSGRPVALVCTSGTAVANYYPAIIEAYYDQIPLIIISADRPYQYSNLDVNQTIDQKNIFGNYCAPTLALPLPSLQMTPSILMEQIAGLIKKECGPIHINVPFDEPLHAKEEKLPSNYLEQWANASPISTINSNQSNIDLEIDHLDQSLLVIGRLPFAGSKENILKLIKYFPGKVYVDASSSIKFRCDRTNDSLTGRYHQIIHLGGRLTDKSYNSFLENCSFKKMIVCNQLINKRDHFPKGFQKINAVPDQLAAKLLPTSQNTTTKSKSITTPQTPYHKLAQAVIDNAASESNLYLANSMAIRMFDQIESQNRKITVACNRAISGIEGFIASSAGLAMATKKETNLVIGDISFLHDCNSLALIKNLPVTIIVANNGGGKIFNQLPVAEDPELLALISTPHHYSFDALAKQFELSYTLIESLSSFAAKFREKKYQIIEVRL